MSDDIVDRLWGLGLSVNVYDRQHGLMAEAAAEIERLRLALARRGGLADYYNWRRPLLVRGRGVYSGWGLATGLLVGDGDGSASS